MTSGTAGTPAGSSHLDVLITRLDPGVPLPGYARPGDAGADLTATTDVELAPGERAVVGTGIAIALPAGYAGFVHPRSGLAARHGITLVNAPGTIDAGYRGEVKVIVLNTSRDQAVTLRRGDRVAQLVVQRVENVIFREVTALPESERGDGGFGSTGGHTAGAGPAGAAPAGVVPAAVASATAPAGDLPGGELTPKRQSSP